MTEVEEFLRAFRDAWNAGEMEAVRSMLHADATHTPPPGWPEPGPYVGRDAVMTHFEQLREAFRAEAIDVEEVTPIGEHVVIKVVWRGTGLGPEAEIRMWQVSSLRDGLLLSLEQYWDRDQAIAAAGEERPN